MRSSQMPLVLSKLPASGFLKELICLDVGILGTVRPCLNSSNLKDVSVNFVTYLNQIMAYSSENPIIQLKKCLTMAQDVGSHAEANRAFEQLCGILDAENPMAAQLLEMLWQEAITARRSAIFWQQMSDVEKDMANRMMENMTEMRQNYLRLMQEM
jgi:hypothetical protein